MDKHIIIIGCSGSVSSKLVERIIEMLVEKKVGVEHASIRTGNQSTLVVGTLEDIGAVQIGEPQPLGLITLETLNGKLDELAQQIAAFAKYEKGDDKKKEVAARRAPTVPKLPVAPPPATPPVPEADKAPVISPIAPPLDGPQTPDPANNEGSPPSDTDTPPEAPEKKEEGAAS